MHLRCGRDQMPTCCGRRKSICTPLWFRLTSWSCSLRPVINVETGIHRIMTEHIGTSSWMGADDASLALDPFHQSVSSRNAYHRRRFFVSRTELPPTFTSKKFASTSFDPSRNSLTSSTVVSSISSASCSQFLVAEKLSFDGSVCFWVTATIGAKFTMPH